MRLLFFLPLVITARRLRNFFLLLRSSTVASLPPHSPFIKRGTDSKKYHKKTTKKIKKKKDGPCSRCFSGNVGTQFIARYASSSAIAEISLLLLEAISPPSREVYVVLPRTKFGVLYYAALHGVPRSNEYASSGPNNLPRVHGAALRCTP